MPRGVANVPQGSVAKCAEIYTLLKENFTEALLALSYRLGSRRRARPRIAARGSGAAAASEHCRDPSPPGSKDPLTNLEPVSLADAQQPPAQEHGQTQLHANYMFSASFGTGT